MSIVIITRRQWGAAPPKSAPEKVTWPEGVDLWVHHTTGPRTQTPREIQAFHQGPSRGWSDIGYGYLVSYDGTIYEGRGYEVQAAHSPGKNHEPSVALIGDYSKDEPSDAMHRAVYDLKEFLRAGDLRGHRENTATSCPGDAAMRKIVDGQPPEPVKRTLRDRLEAAGYAPTTVTVILANLAAGISGEQPNPNDSQMFKNLRREGLSAESARAVIRSLRKD